MIGIIVFGIMFIRTEGKKKLNYEENWMKNIGFIGVGYMGYGIAKNILKHKNKLFVIANKNRKPIEKIVE